MKVKQNEMVLFSIIKEGEYGLLNPLSRKLHRINETGRIIWDSCEEARDTAEIAPMVAQHFHVSQEAIQKDVEDFIDRMITFELLESI